MELMRKSWDQHFLAIAQEVASMGTCTRRQVGCVLVDDRRVILSTGFNGVPPKWDHCRGTVEEGARPCPGASAESGTGLDLCYANHAEVNALLHCSDVMRAHTCYTTSSPCISCVKILLCTGVCRIVFCEEYPHPEAKELWTRTSLFLPQRRGPLADHRTWERWEPAMGGIVVVDSSGLR
jgi:dCMP deaminase